MTAFQERGVALDFVENRRAAIPYGLDQIEIMLRMVRELTPAPKLVVDLGCGDGILARALLDAYPDARAVLIDQSAPMLEKARQSMARFGDRHQIVQGDLRDPIGHRMDVARAADVVVSGYAIHHMPDERKKSLYADIFDALTPGGLFINIEHVSSPDARVETIFDTAFIEHMAQVLKTPVEQMTREHNERPDKADNILAPLDSQLRWLREIGFTHVDCYFKWFELAVFGGQKAR